MFCLCLDINDIMTFSVLVCLFLAQVFFGEKNDNSPASKALVEVAMLLSPALRVFVWCSGLL